MPKQNARPSADTYGFEKGLAVVAKLGLATCFLQAKYNLDNSNVNSYGTWELESTFFARWRKRTSTCITRRSHN
jgi:hypothetical protein